MSEAHDAFSVIVHMTVTGTVAGGHFIENTAGVISQGDGARSAFGVLAQTEDAADGDTVPICVMGPCKVWANGTGAIAVGSYIASDASGHAVVDSTAGHRIMGMALEATSTNGVFIEALIYPSLG